MKKKFITLMATTVLVAAMISGCGSNETDDRTTDEVQTQQSSETTGMVHLESPEDVNAFFEELYQGVDSNILPSGISTMELDLQDIDTLTYNTGIADTTGIDAVYVSESMIGSVAYSAVYIRTTDDADAKGIMQTVMDNVNPAKWICVTAQKQIASTFGNDVFFVMGAEETADAVYAQAKSCAEAKSMTVSEAVEKVNAQ